MISIRAPLAFRQVHFPSTMSASQKIIQHHSFQPYVSRFTGPAMPGVLEPSHVTTEQVASLCSHAVNRFRKLVCTKGFSKHADLLRNCTKHFNRLSVITEPCR
jgi:hypothetical protein